MKKNVLAIEDEQTWLDNYAAWLSEEFDLEGANETSKAEKLLQEKRYHVVILDLAMSLYDQTERQNIGIQRYLAPRPEGTRCIVVSAVADKRDTKLAYENMAVTVIFKPEIDPIFLLEEIKKAFEEVAKNDRGLIEQSFNLLFGGCGGNELIKKETKLLKTLCPDCGITGLVQIFSNVLEPIYPIIMHKETSRQGLIVNEEGYAFGLFWSRQVGHAVSIVLSKKDLAETEATARLDEWLGWAHGSESVYQKEISNVRVQCFKEELSSEGFALPKIS